MKVRPTFFSAFAVLASAPVLAAPTAVERQGVVIQGGVVVQGGLQFQKPIVLEQAALCDGSVRLPKGSYDITFTSLGGNKIRASFFQGGAKRGEALGTILIGGKTQTGPGGGPHTATFSELGLGPTTAHSWSRQGDKLDLVLQQGTNKILIGLLLPAVNERGIIAVSPQQKH